MNIPLIGEDGICHFINVSDKILYLQTNKSGKMRFYSAANKFRPVQSVEEWSKLLGTAGFVRVDRGTVVNLSKVYDLDPDLRVLGIRTENGGKLSIPVAAAMMRRVQAELKNRR